MLDEIDKLGRNSLNGDPSSALLEVLDPEQNQAFRDHYLNLPFNLSKVLFIATANELDPIPRPLYDRMEVLEMSGYTVEEKVQIALRHLLPKQRQYHGLADEQLRMDVTVVDSLISKYTREAGVRELDRQLAALCRSVAARAAEAQEAQAEAEARAKESAVSGEAGAVSGTAVNAKESAVSGEAGSKASGAVASGAPTTAPAPTTAQLPACVPLIAGAPAGADAAAQAAERCAAAEASLAKTGVVSADVLTTVLGPPKYDGPRENAFRLTKPGIVAGLAYTSVGGDLLYVEAEQMAGRGEIVLTGQLGDVMKESAMAARSWIRAHAHELGLVGAEPGAVSGGPLGHFLNSTDLHIHFPAGAVPKDGPSAGVTITTAIVSLLTGRKVRPDLAMTGEVTLRGLVLPVGGIKEKVIAAHRGGMRTVILPAKNEKDLRELPQTVLRDMTFILVREIREVLDAALLPADAKDSAAEGGGAHDGAAHDGAAHDGAGRHEVPPMPMPMPMPPPVAATAAAASAWMSRGKFRAALTTALMTEHRVLRAARRPPNAD